MNSELLIQFLLTGALAGFLAGALTGAIVVPVVQAPDTLSRGLLVGILLALGMAIFELSRISVVTGTSLGSILGAFQGGLSGVVGEQIYVGTGRVLLAFLVGVIIGLLSAVPDKVLRGALFGVFMGAVLGGILQIIMKQFNLPYAFENAPLIFRIAVGLLTWGIMTAVSR